MNVEETLKHIGTYWDIYRYIGQEERSFDAIKKYLMKECDKPESTARANISGFKTAKDTIIKISPDGKSVSVDPRKWNSLFWTMDERMHFSDYDDRAQESKAYFDAYIEGTNEITDLTFERDKLQEELSKQEERHGNHGNYARSYERVIRYLAELVEEYHSKTLFFFLEELENSGFAKELLIKTEDYL